MQVREACVAFKGEAWFKDKRVDTFEISTRLNASLRMPSVFEAK